jgi:hypothetical protein
VVYFSVPPGSGKTIMNLLSLSGIAGEKVLKVLYITVADYLKTDVQEKAEMFPNLEVTVIDSQANIKLIDYYEIVVYDEYYSDLAKPRSKFQKTAT